MPENPRPSSSSSLPETETGELNFSDPALERPRMKRRTLKAKLPPGKPLPGAEGSSSETVSTPLPDEPKAHPAPAPVVEETAPAKTYFRTTVQPSASAPAPPSSPSSPLYYSTTPRKEKEDAPPMKSTSPSSASPSNGPSASSMARPVGAASTPINSMNRTTSTAAMPSPSSARPNSVVDYRSNIERQAREQKSVGSLLQYLVYGIGAILVLGFGLAGYGAYTLSRQIHQQSVTVADLDARYAAQNKALNTHLAATDDTIAQAQADVTRQEELIVRQQEALNKLLAANDALATALRTERSTRASETSSLREEISDMRDDNAKLRTQIRVLEEQPHF